MSERRAIAGHRAGSVNGHFWRVVGWLMLLMLSPMSKSADLAAERSYFVDPGGQLGFEQVLEQAFIPYQGVLSKGYGSDAVWIRLRVERYVGEVSEKHFDASRLIVRIEPGYLDEIRLFDPFDVSRPANVARVTGDRYPPQAEEYQPLHFNFVIPSSAEARDIWLRLQTTSTRLISVEVLPVEEAIARDRLQLLFYSFFIALFVLFFVWALIHWLTQRDVVVGAFVFKQVLGIMWALAVLGYVRTFLGDIVPVGVIDKTTSLLILGYTTGSIFFDYTLLREYDFPRWGRWLMFALMAFLPLNLLLMAVGATMHALQINQGVILLTTIGVFTLACCSRPRGGAGQEDGPALPWKWVVVVYGLVMLSIGLTVATNLGLIPGNTMALHGLIVHGLLTGVLIVVLLQVRAWRMDQRRALAVMQLAVVEEGFRREVERRKQQHAFIAMLTHELKTPLSIIKVVLGLDRPSPSMRDSADQAVLDIDAVVDQCAQANAMEGDVPADRSACRMIDELQSLCARRDDSGRIVFDADADAPATVCTDRQLLGTIVANLMNNALKYSPAGSPVSVRYAAAADGVCITVSNLPGPAGWPDPEQLFKQYYRSPRARRLTGSGLGLNISALLARRLGGTLRYTPDATQVKFILCLPR